MPFTEDLDVFFPDFGVAANAGAVDFLVIFDRASVLSLGGSVESTGPQCVGKTSDLGALVEGSAITINGAAYTVKDNLPDGTGITVLELHLAT